MRKSSNVEYRAIKSLKFTVRSCSQQLYLGCQQGREGRRPELDPVHREVLLHPEVGVRVQVVVLLARVGCPLGRDLVRSFVGVTAK